MYFPPRTPRGSPRNSKKFLIDNCASSRSPKGLCRSPRRLATLYRVDAGNRTGRQVTSVSNVRFGSSQLRIRPIEFQAMRVPNPAANVNSDKNEKLLLMFIWPPNLARTQVSPEHRRLLTTVHSVHCVGYVRCRGDLSRQRAVPIAAVAETWATLD